MIYLIFILFLILRFIEFALVGIVVITIGMFITERLETYESNRAIIKQRQLVEKTWKEYLQKKCRRELRREEQKKYPLFYLKDGIV